ncbi:MAG: hypothetical protein KTR24_07535 [Saprospiraceae bacterium]|nr:hypothetical protein [Saprospiraceae bacterium]
MKIAALSTLLFMSSMTLFSQIEVAVHRGANRHAPENTWAAAYLAIEHGGDYLEIDVRENEEGIFYDFHDSSLDRTTGSTGSFATLTHSQIEKLDVGAWYRHEFTGARVPRVDSLVQQLKGKIKFYFDFKSGDIERFFDLVDAWGISDQCFFNQPDALIPIVAKSGLPYKVNVSNTEELKKAKARWNPPIVEVRTHDLTKDLIDSAHAMGTKVMAYVPGDQITLWRKCLEFDIDMINLDCPQRFREMEAGRTSLPQWIAHRGGVVSDTVPEYSLASIEMCTTRGYHGVEFDLWQSMDGELFVHHDETLQRYFGKVDKVNELTSEELRVLKGQHGAYVPTLGQYLAALPQDMDLMVDIKVPPEDRSDQFYATLRSSIEERHDLRRCLFIDQEARRHYWKLARFGVRIHELQDVYAEWQKGEDIACHYFLFDHGNRLNAESVRLAQHMSMEVIPSVNVFHYRQENALFGGRRDIQVLRELGVTTFQIDSTYDR